MGDRANVKFVEENGGEMFFYTHWAGAKLPSTVQDALRRGEDRWDDDSYLARIVFCEMVKNDINGLTGYGLSTRRIDSWGRDDLIVDASRREVQIGHKSWTFKEFCSLSADQLAEYWK